MPDNWTEMVSAVSAALTFIAATVIAIVQIVIMKKQNVIIADQSNIFNKQNEIISAQNSIAKIQSNISLFELRMQLFKKVLDMINEGMSLWPDTSGFQETLDVQGQPIQERHQLEKKYDYIVIDARCLVEPPLVDIIQEVHINYDWVIDIINDRSIHPDQVRAQLREPKDKLRGIFTHIFEDFRKYVDFSSWHSDAEVKALVPTATNTTAIQKKGLI